MAQQHASNADRALIALCNKRNQQRSWRLTEERRDELNPATRALAKCPRCDKDYARKLSLWHVCLDTDPALYLEECKRCSKFYIPRWLNCHACVDSIGQSVHLDGDAACAACQDFYGARHELK